MFLIKVFVKRLQVVEVYAAELAEGVARHAVAFGEVSFELGGGVPGEEGEVVAFVDVAEDAEGTTVLAWCGGGGEPMGCD